MVVLDGWRLSEFLEAVAASLDIPDGLHEEAVRKYEHVGHWLEEKDACEGRQEPSIYPQGSFRLGTVVRPISEGSGYDIDLVYERDLGKSSVSQEQLKNDLGERLRQYIAECKESHRDAPALSVGRRCWRLEYVDGFHMDVLPAIPDEDGRKESITYSKTKIVIPDRDLMDWQNSNPIGYAKWFMSRMAIQFQKKRASLAQGMAYASAEGVPEYKVKTPLQLAIQILKRHRDIHFAHDEEDKPISIIISTLAANSYNNQADLIESILAIVKGMEKWIEEDFSTGKRVAWVRNPTNAQENFADKWETHPQRERKCRDWLRKVEEDFAAALSAETEADLLDILGESFGHKRVALAAARLGTRPQNTKPLAASASVDTLSTRHCKIPPWTQDLRYEATIAASVSSPRRDRAPYVLTDQPVAKGARIRFDLSTNTPEPYEIHWQVVNTGQEAADDNGLRGGFDDDINQQGSTRWESTAYEGSHWIEAFIVKKGYCVARTGRKYVRIRS